MSKVAAAILACALAAASGASLAAGDAAAGKGKSAACSACHGPDGNSSVPMYPKLAGQHAQYLELAIKAYRSGERSGGQTGMMKPMVANLSDQDIADLAAYYAAQPAK